MLDSQQVMTLFTGLVLCPTVAPTSCQQAHLITAIWQACNIVLYATSAYAFNGLLSRKQFKNFATRLQNLKPVSLPFNFLVLCILHAYIHILGSYKCILCLDVLPFYTHSECIHISC